LERVLPSERADDRRSWLGGLETRPTPDAIALDGTPLGRPERRLSGTSSAKFSGPTPTSTERASRSASVALVTSFGYASG
jgi:hypothetical protein